MSDLELSSTAFAAGDPIPQRYTCEGDDVSPALQWKGLPEGAVSLALLCEDPDAPGGTFVHWVAWGLNPAAGGLDEGEAAPAEGRNDFGTTGYRGPCPPPGHGAHRYFFRLYALDGQFDLAEGASRQELDRATDGRALGSAELMGTYER